MMVLVTGGSGSGKSAFAEDTVLQLDENGSHRIYIATMYPYDEESKKRVLRHRDMRKDKHFETIECFTDIGSLEISPDSTVLLECMSNLVANEMFMPEGAGEDTFDCVCKGIVSLKKQSANLVIVTNEIFSEAQIYEGDTSIYMENLGKINQFCAEMADLVYEVVYGIPVMQKGVLGK
ncbi:MAG: bifunctional adenosylcobinamide kinase/adenosylcobinamide-phosphate guanylyltransferase [Eubacteriales bacterium]|nr:bifunctional adenosylcobinamide kinase/adenosylcobinamide-phosphate guanylyltransferase [Eubacteriales bacterium]